MNERDKRNVCYTTCGYSHFIFLNCYDYKNHVIKIMVIYRFKILRFIKQMKNRKGDRMNDIEFERDIDHF